MKIVIALFLFAPALSMAAAPIPKNKVEEFFSSVMKADIAGGYDRLFEGSTIPQDKPQAVTLLKNQTQNGLPLYGKILGYDFIKEEDFGSSIVRLVYVLKSEKVPTTWEFYFYKPKGSWFLANIIFNDQFSLLR